MGADRPGKAIVSLFAMLICGCASQNAMQLVPAEVKLEIAKGRTAPPDAKKQAVKGEAASSGGQASGPDLAALKKLADGARGGAPLAETNAESGGKSPARKSPDFPEAAPDPRELLEQALAAQGAGDGDPDSAGEDAWRRLLAHGAPKAPPAPVDTLTTSAVPASSAAIEPVSVAFQDNGEKLDRDSDVRLRLMKHGGRVAQRIVIGRIDAGSPQEALAQAAIRSRLIAAVCGGDPDLGYDPALPAGGAVVHYRAHGIGG